MYTAIVRYIAIIVDAYKETVDSQCKLSMNTEYIPHVHSSGINPIQSASQQNCVYLGINYFIFSLV